jgi:hypothetical protein
MNWISFLESVPELESILFLFFQEPDLEVDSTYYSWFYLYVELEPRFFVLDFLGEKTKNES